MGQYPTTGSFPIYDPVEKLRSFFVDFRLNPSKGQYPPEAAEGQYVMKNVWVYA
jgi:hypothetical protein